MINSNDPPNYDLLSNEEYQKAMFYTPVYSREKNLDELKALSDQIVLSIYGIRDFMHSTTPSLNNFSINVNQDALI